MSKSVAISVFSLGGWRKGRGTCVRNIGHEHDFCQAQKAENTDRRTNYAVNMLLLVATTHHVMPNKCLFYRLHKTFTRLRFIMTLSMKNGHSVFPELRLNGACGTSWLSHSGMQLQLANSPNRRDCFWVFVFQVRDPGQNHCIDNSLGIFCGVN